MKSDGIGFWTRVAALFLVRSGRATAALSIMVVTAVAALIFLSALAVGVNDAMLRNTVGLFSGHITGYELSAELRPEKLIVEGVAGVLKRVCLPGVLSKDDLDQPLTMCGLDADREAALTALAKKIVVGGYPRNGHAEMMISKPLAAELGVQKGADLRFTSPSLDGPLRLTVAGIYQTQIEQLDRGVVFCPLDVLPENGAPWSAAVFLRHGVDPQAVIDRYRQKWPGQYRFESWAAKMPDLRQLIDLQYISMGIVIILVFSVVSVGIACSFVIFIVRNLREFGIMKAMGVTNREMSMLIVMKVALMNAVACAVGVGIGAIVVWAVAGTGGIDISAFTSHNRYFTVSGIISPRLTAFSLLAPPAAAFGFSLMAALWPAAVLARKRAAHIIRMI